MKTIILIGFVLLSFNLFSQTNNGYYVTNTNDTIKCQVETKRTPFSQKMNISELYLRVLVIENGVHKKFKAHEIKSFTVYDTNDKEYKFASVAGVKEYFVNVLVEGTLSLYNLYSTDTFDLSFSPIEVMIKEGEIYYLNIGNPQQKIGELIYDSPELKKEWIAGHKYKSNDKAELVKDYNIYMKNKSLNSKKITNDTLKTQLSESNIIATQSPDTIEIIKKFGEIKGYRNGELLTYKNYKLLFANNPNALEQIRTSNFLHKTGNFFGTVGGFMFGFIGVVGLKNINSVDYTWGMALGASAAIVGVGYIIYSSGNNSQIKAIKTYNNHQRYLLDKEKVSVKIGFTNSGVGLVYSF